MDPGVGFGVTDSGDVESTKNLQAEVEREIYNDKVGWAV
jgi:hypothetical protein